MNYCEIIMEDQMNPSMISIMTANNRYLNTKISVSDKLSDAND